MFSRHVTGLLFATMFPQIAVAMISLAPPVVGDQIIADLGLSPAVVGAYTGLVYIFVFVSNLITPQLVAAFGALRLSFGCIVLGGLTLAVFGNAALVVAIAATVFIGLSYGPLTPATSFALVTMARSSGFNLLVSIRQTSVPLGGMLAGLVVPYLNLLYGWRTALTIVGLGLALLGLGTAFLLKSVRDDRPPAGFGASKGIFAPFLFIVRRPRLFRLALASLVYGALQLIMSSFIVLYLVSQLKVDHVWAGIFLGVMQISGIFGRIFWGYLADRMRSPRLMMALIGFGMAVSALVTGALTEGIAPMLIGAAMVAFGATASGWNGVFLAEVMREVEPSQAGFATAGGLFFVYIGVIVGPPLFGLAVSAFDFRASFAGLAAVALMAGVMCLERRAPD